jgi:hypothetical protein
MFQISTTVRCQEMKGAVVAADSSAPMAKMRLTITDLMVVNSALMTAGTMLAVRMAVMMLVTTKATHMTVEMTIVMAKTTFARGTAWK